MKIALFTETYLPYVNGVVTHVKALKDGLEKKGHTVLVVTANTDTYKHFIKDGILNCPAKRIKKIYNYGLASPISLKRLSILKEFNPDIIHIHQEFGVGLSGRLIADRLDIPLIYTLHTMYDDYMHYLIPKTFIPTFKKIGHKYAKYVVKRVDVLVGPSAKVQDFFNACGIKRTVTVVPNSVELDLFNCNKISQEKIDAVRKKYDIKDDEVVACFCGRLGREKSIDVLMKYWARMVKPEDKLRLMILGGGPCLEELKELAKELGLEKSIIITGAVDHYELPAYYAAANLYITASLTEVNSISMKEAMAVGLAVVSINDTKNQGQIAQGINGFIYNDATEMYQILKDYIKMSPQEKQDLKNNVISSMNIYSNEALATYLLTVYQNAIDERKNK